MRTSSQQRRIAADLRYAVTALAARARAERGGVLTLTQVAVLGRVLVVGPITPGELAAQLGMAPQSLTRPLAALEREGLALRTADPSDGRGALIGATDAGRRAMREEMAPRDRWVGDALAATCSQDELELLGRAAEVIRRLAEHDAGVAPLER